ncbi:hypothetical protein [Mycobacterium interjectum]|nr:hypothetical protein [Mycobacterium interjectum]
MAAAPVSPGLPSLPGLPVTLGGTTGRLAAVPPLTSSPLTA